MLVENFIQYRFASENKYSKIVFKSQNISYHEVMMNLNKYKKIHFNTDNDKIQKADKIDRIKLINLDKNGEEITKESGMIEANTKIEVIREPWKKLDPIMVSYNQMNNNLTKFKDKKRMNPGVEIDIGDLTEYEDDDKVEEKEDVVEDLDVDNDEIDFDSYEIDAMKSDREF